MRFTQEDAQVIIDWLIVALILSGGGILLACVVGVMIRLIVVIGGL